MKLTLVNSKLIEVSMNRMLTTHAEAGYIIISACRHEFTKKENFIATANLINKIKTSGFSYLPVFGGFIERDKNTDTLIKVKEESFIVFNFKRSIKQPDTKELYRLGLHLIQPGTTSEYGQESFLYKLPNEPKAIYIGQNGSVVYSFTSVSVTRDVDMYFTSLNKNINKRTFTFRESYYLDSPNSVQEASQRSGEIFFVNWTGKRRTNFSVVKNK